MKYKFRAECSQDAEQFKQENIEAISEFQIVKVEGFPDVDVTFDSHLELSEIIELMRDIDDGHVMYQTVKPLEEYTGERDYDLCRRHGCNFK